MVTKIQEVAVEIIKVSVEVEFLEKMSEVMSPGKEREAYILRLVQNKVKLTELVEQLRKLL